MMNKKLTIWHWIVILFDVLALVVMLDITAGLMPSRGKAEHKLFMNTLLLIQEIDPIAKKTYISDLEDKYLHHKGLDIDEMAALEQIAKDYPSPEFKQKFDRLKAEREEYLNNLKSDQIEAISSTIFAWLIFVLILNLGGFIAIRLIKWGYSNLKDEQ